MLCVAAESDEDAKVALPLLSSMTGEPSGVVPSLNVTVPVALTGVTIAVSVTGSPAIDGFNEDVSVVVVASLLTPKLMSMDIGRNDLSPE